MHAASDDLSPPNVETNVGTGGDDLTPPTTEAKPKRAKKAKKEAAPAVEGEVKAEEKKTPSRANLSKTYPEDAVITVLAESNPKKAGSAAASIFDLDRKSVV